MRRYATIYYLLFVLLVMGAFASMAQNAYGIKICGVACLGFALTFLHEIFFMHWAEDEQFGERWMVYAELLFLSAIASVFLFRNFSSDLPFSDTLLIVSLTGLLLLFSYQAFIQLQHVSGQNGLLYLLIFYYGSVVFFVLSFLTGIVYPGAALTFTLVALVLVAVFGLLTLVFKKRTSEGDGTTVWLYLRRVKTKSSILLIAAILVSGYGMLYSAGILPPFYYGTPKGYQDLVTLSGDEATKEKSREFKERYDTFVRKYSAP